MTADVLWRQFGYAIRQRVVAEECNIRELSERLEIPLATLYRAMEAMPIRTRPFLIIAKKFLDLDPRLFLR